MAQQFDYPKTETQLREIQDKLYQHSKEVYDAGGRPAFKGLVEIMSAEATIITAIHNIKSNHGSETPGVDFKTMQRDYLQRPFSWVIKDIQNAFRHFQPQKIRRVYIDKPGKTEKRPLGIPTIRDRIVQECMRIVLEPILGSAEKVQILRIPTYKVQNIGTERILSRFHPDIMRPIADQNTSAGIRNTPEWHFWVETPQLWGIRHIENPQKFSCFLNFSRLFCFFSRP